MSDELQKRLQQLAQKAHGETYKRALGLIGSDTILDHLVGSNGVVILTPARVVFSLGTGSIQRAGEMALTDAHVQAVTAAGDLLMSLVLTGRPHEGGPSPTYALKAAGDAAEDFVALFLKAQAAASERASERTYAQGAGVSHVTQGDYQAPQAGERSPAQPNYDDGLLVTLRPPENMAELLGLLERLGDLQDQGFLTLDEFTRCKRHLLGGVG